MILAFPKLVVAAALAARVRARDGADGGRPATLGRNHAAWFMGAEHAVYRARYAATAWRPFAPGEKAKLALDRSL